MTSPLGTLYRLGAKILLIGVSYDRSTSFHLAEDIFGKFPKVIHGSAIIENGTRAWKRYENYDYPADSFILLGDEYEKNGLVQTGKLGSANCKLFDMKASIDFGVEWFTENKII